VPTKKVEVDYADAILKYKDFVEVEYTANYISGDFQVQVIRDETGAAFVHYSIEPARITVEEAGGRYEVRFLLTGRVSDGAGKTIHQFDKEFPFSLTAAEVDDLRSKTISIQDVFPLVPGVYTFDILLKNVLSKEFTGAGRTITVPGPAGPPALSPLLLAYGLEPGAADRGGKVPFKVGGTQILCQTKKGFGTKDSLVLFYQLSGLTDELLKTSSLATVFLREDQEVLRRTLPVADTPASGVIDVQDLRTFTPGYYQVRVSLVDGAGRELALARENFEISLAPALPRPMVMAKVASSGGAEDGLLTTGRQLANEGNFEAAAEKLAAAHVRAPQRPDIAVAYAQVLFRQKDYARVLDVLRPFEGDDTPAPEVPALLGQACHALARYDEAAKYYTAYITRFGANIDILNYLGTCHFQLGNTAQALQAWEKSLELSPNQEKLRALVDSIKKR
jgi:Flp pilus assembly protein TadD